MNLIRYCIGCVHCVFAPGSEGFHSETTWDTGDDAQLFCAKKHWRVEMHKATREQFRAFMETGDTCCDYEERPSPERSELLVLQARNESLSRRVANLEKVVNEYPHNCGICPYREALKDT